MKFNSTRKSIQIWSQPLLLVTLVAFAVCDRPSLQKITALSSHWSTGITWPDGHIYSNCGRVQFWSLKTFNWDFFNFFKKNCLFKFSLKWFKLTLSICKTEKIVLAGCGSVLPPCATHADGTASHILFISLRPLCAAISAPESVDRRPVRTQTSAGSLLHLFVGHFWCGQSLTCVDFTQVINVWLIVPFICLPKIIELVDGFTVAKSVLIP